MVLTYLSIVSFKVVQITLFYWFQNAKLCISGLILWDCINNVMKYNLLLCYKTTPKLQNRKYCFNNINGVKVNDGTQNLQSHEFSLRKKFVIKQGAFYFQLLRLFHVFWLQQTHFWTDFNKIWNPESLGHFASFALIKFLRILNF